MQGAVLAYLGCPDVNGPKAVDGAAEHLLARSLVQGKGLASEDGLIHGGLSPDDDAVYRDGFARQDAQNITGLDLLRRDQLFLSAPDSPALGGGQMDPLFEAFSGAVCGHIFQNGADGHNPRHLSGCK